MVSHGSTSCRCKVNDAKRRHINLLFPTSVMVALGARDTACVCLSEDSEVHQHATIDSSSEEAVVLHSTKTACPRNTWVDSPPEEFVSDLRLSFRGGVVSHCMIVVAKEMANQPRPSQKEEGVDVPQRAVAEA